jgi:hypothetical protein
LKRAHNIVATLSLVAILMVATERSAAAYIDPGTGAVIWQSLCAGFVGLIFFFRKHTFKLFSNRREKEQKDLKS